MGKVFSSSELTQGAYPEPGAHNNIAEQLMHDVRSIAATHNIPVAAMVYGSVAVAAATRTSDIDFLLVHEVEEAKVAVPALQFSSLARYYQAVSHVPISVNFIARAHMAERYSLQDPLFTENLAVAYRHSPERFVFGNPIAGMTTLAHLPTTELRHDAALSTTHSYINERIARIVEAFAESTINPEIALKVAINLPSTLGRKIARVAEIHHALMHDMPSEKNGHRLIRPRRCPERLS